MRSNTFKSRSNWMEKSRSMFLSAAHFFRLKAKGEGVGEEGGKKEMQSVKEKSRKRLRQAVLKETKSEEESVVRARENLFSYCKIKAPGFYKDERLYQKEMCEAIEDFLAGEEDVLILNAPPRHGKSRTAQLAVEWILGRDGKKKIMTGSYNETLATQFSKGVRNAISEEKADKSKIVFRDIFPDTKIKAGDAAMNLWSLEGGYNNYLATSPTGTATGFGADILIIDDLIKNAYEASNEEILGKHWEWFSNTMLSRLESGGKVIIIMTRWHSKDLAGRAMEELPKIGYRIRQISFQALQPDGSMLCEAILSRKDYDKKAAVMSKEIALANYQQEPIDVKGRLYTSFKTYDEIPKDSYGNSLFTRIKAYCDTADTGADYLCNLIYGEYEREAYILDIYYTKDPMEITEKETAKRYRAFKVNDADIESNNGGRGFARAVERILEGWGWNRTKINWFHQAKNKKARILSNASWVMEHIYYPEGWEEKYPEYYDSMIRYQKEGKNKHDDAQDATTGVAEKAELSGIYSFD